MAVQLILDILLIVISAINIFVQLIGLHLLLSIYHNGRDKGADLYIISLSFAELVCSTLICIEYFTNEVIVYMCLTSFHFSATALI